MAEKDNITSDGEIKFKTCTKCGESFKITEDFWKKDARCSDGLSSKCRSCTSYTNHISIKPNMECRICGICGVSISLDCEDWAVDKRVENKTRVICFECQVDRLVERRKLVSIYAKERSNSIASCDFVDGLSKYEKTNGDAVQCAYCGGWFQPTNQQVKARLRAINSGFGGSRLYCSNNCKKSCPIFHRSKWPKGYKKATSREANPLLRQLVLNRDDYTCQKCGATIQEAQLHCHHVVPATQNPMTANDPDACITLCKKCHKAVHKKPGCGYHELRCDIHEEKAVETA